MQIICIQISYFNNCLQRIIIINLQMCKLLGL